MEFFYLFKYQVSFSKSGPEVPKLVQLKMVQSSKQITFLMLSTATFVSFLIDQLITDT